MNKLSIIGSSVLISVKVKSSKYNLFFIAAVLGWSLKSSSVRFKSDSCILGVAKKSFSTALGLNISCPLPERRMFLGEAVSSFSRTD